ncbi:MAG: hypothetical protein DVB30_05730 [Verrucomicrobia bacterium]|nr:MAG: hypothetical protein DVB30_05730 [Verrucomicrobiota bacterium]
MMASLKATGRLSLARPPHPVWALGIALLLIIDQPDLLATDTPAAWEKPREIARFQSLITKSPFALPTAEESSPLGERYAITGILTIGGKEQVFVFDRNDQSRELLTSTPNAKNMMLVSIQREGTAQPTKATIRVGTETGTISYLEAAPQPAPASPVAGAPQTPGRGPVQLPPLPSLPKQPITAQGQPGQQPTTPPTRRIIRRPVIAPQQTAAPK